MVRRCRRGCASLSELSADDANDLREKLAGIISDIRASADELDNAHGGRQHPAATAIRNATVFPDETCIFAVRTPDGLMPLIVGWGFESHDPAAVQLFDVSTFAQAKRPASQTTVSSGAAVAAAASSQTRSAGHQAAGAAMATAPHASGTVIARRGGWLPLLLSSLAALLVFALVVAFLLPACGLRTPFGVIVFGLPDRLGCGVQVASAAETARNEAHQLELELAVLREEYRRRRIQCFAERLQESEFQEQASPTETPSEEFEDRIDNRGDVQVTLIWNTTDDVDLSVLCPNQNSIYYKRRRSCGGELDVDANANQRSITREPVENITFADGLTIPGEHQIRVRLYKGREGRYPIPFSVRIRDQNGERVIDGELTREKPLVTIDRLTAQ